MLLASVADVRESIGFDDMPDVVSAVRKAMDGVEPRLSAMLRTEFGRVDGQVDLFFVERPQVRHAAHVPAVNLRTAGGVRTEMLLSRGFVAPGSVEVLVSSHVDGFDPEDSPTDITAEVRLNESAGELVSLRHDFRAAWVQVTYDAGFETDVDDPQSYDLSQVPSWLQEAARLATLATLSDNPVFANADAGLDSKSLWQQVEAVVVPKTRYAPTALLSE